MTTSLPDTTIDTINTTHNTSRTSQEDDLFKVISKLSSPVQAQLFFRDLCTPQEVKAMSERWHVVKLLSSNKLSYRQINQLTGISLTTITRVARFLKQENNFGYQQMLDITS